MSRLLPASIDSPLARRAAPLAALALVVGGCTSSDHLPFAVELNRTTFAVYDGAQPASSTGAYASAAIPFANFKGSRYVVAAVSLSPFDERPRNVPGVAAPDQLNQLMLHAQMVLAGNQVQEVPVVVAGGVLEASADAPTSALSFQFSVTSQDPQLVFYTRGLTGVTSDNLPADITILRTISGKLSVLLAATPQSRAQIDGTTAASQDLNDFGYKYQDALDALEVANHTTSLGLDQAKAGRNDLAAQTMATAAPQVTTALAKLNVARLRLLDVLTALPKDATELFPTIIAVDQQSRHLAATAQLVAAHFYIVSHTLADLPSVTLDIAAPGTGFHTVRRAIDVSTSDDTQPSPLLHQYGHAVFALATGLPPLTTAHQASTSSSKQVAWREGFATFFAQAVLGSPTYTDPSVHLVQDLEKDQVDGKDVAHGSDVESNVQSALWWIYRGASGGPADPGGGGLGVPFSQLWQCLATRPDTFDDYALCLKKSLSPADATRLDALLSDKAKIP